MDDFSWKHGIRDLIHGESISMPGLLGGFERVDGDIVIVGKVSLRSTIFSARTLIFSTSSAKDRFQMFRNCRKPPLEGIHTCRRLATFALEISDLQSLFGVLIFPPGFVVVHVAFNPDRHELSLFPYELDVFRSGVCATCSSLDYGRPQPGDADLEMEFRAWTSMHTQGDFWHTGCS
jgi:hypothetical protein